MVVVGSRTSPAVVGVCEGTATSSSVLSDMLTLLFVATRRGKCCEVEIAVADGIKKIGFEEDYTKEADFALVYNFLRSQGASSVLSAPGCFAFSAVYQGYGWALRDCTMAVG
jgi:hypothetical protein